MKQVPTERLDALVASAQASPRRRLNLNLHETAEDPIQRLANAVEPDSLIRPHCHPRGWELLFAVRGRFVVLCFDDVGVVTERVVLGGDASFVELAAGQWHALLALDAGSVIFEVKPGPYVPADAAQFAAWGDADVGAPQQLLDWYASAGVGDRYGALRGG